MKPFIRRIVVAILKLESRIIIKKYKPFVIAVTGSVGKTTTKDAIYSILAPHFFARKSDKSFNSEIGIPLTILGQPNAWSNPLKWLSTIVHGIDLILLNNKYPKVLILEIGADHPGDIRNTVKWLRPHIAVLTKIGAVPVHVEFFASREEVFKEKESLALGVEKGGTVILYGDDPEIGAIKVPQAGATILYGFENQEVHAEDYGVTYDERGTPTGIEFSLVCRGIKIPLKLPGVIGRQQVYPILVAAAVGITKGLSLAQIGEAAEKHVPPKGRMNIIEGVNGSTLIDDTYNSSPDAVVEALSVLAGITTKGRKIAVLGDMMELGKYSPEAHEKIGPLAKVSTDMLVTVGVRAQKIRDGAIKANMPAAQIISFDTSKDAAARLPSMVTEGDIILIKGSQSPRLERITAALLKDQARARELLVRQDAEWLARP